MSGIIRTTKDVEAYNSNMNIWLHHMSMCVRDLIIITYSCDKLLRNQNTVKVVSIVGTLDKPANVTHETHSMVTRHYLSKKVDNVLCSVLAMFDNGTNEMLLTLAKRLNRNTLQITISIIREIICSVREKREPKYI